MFQSPPTRNGFPSPWGRPVRQRCRMRRHPQPPWPIHRCSDAKGCGNFQIFSTKIQQKNGCHGLKACFPLTGSGYSCSSVYLTSWSTISRSGCWGWLLWLCSTCLFIILSAILLYQSILCVVWKYSTNFLQSVLLPESACDTTEPLPILFGWHCQRGQR